MRKFLYIILCSLVLTGCVSQADYDELQEEYDALKGEKTALREENDKLQAEVASLKAEIKEAKNNKSSYDIDIPETTEETSPYDYKYTFDENNEICYWLSDDDNLCAIGTFSSVENASLVYLLSATDMLIHNKTFGFVAKVGNDTYYANLLNGAEYMNTLPQDYEESDIDIIEFSSELEDVYNQYGL